MEHKINEKQLIALQRNEISEYHTYMWLAKHTRNQKNREILERIAYIITVLILIAPYLLFSNVYLSLLVMMTLNVGIILSYNFYITTAKGLPLWRRFGQMVTISFGVACLSFLLGLVARAMFGVEL